MAYISINNRGYIAAISDKPFENKANGEVQEIKGAADVSMLGRQVIDKKEKLKLAVICNWGQNCGISTYTKYLIDNLRPKLGELRIFSEEGCEATNEVDPCWKRGQSMHATMKKVIDWNPDFVMIQHEFGIFPKAPFLLQMLQMLDTIPYVVVLHSTYEHLDKTICTSAMKHILVHSNVAKGVLNKLGNKGDIHVIPHGCVQFPDRKSLWNIYQTDHAIVQFGFGFFYKGVDRAIEAVAKLKAMKPDKYHDIFYCYYCSESGHCKNIHDEYMSFLMGKVEALGLQDNVVIIKKYNSDEEVNNILRTAKLAIFPYLINAENKVYGASGAARIAMANGIPVIASESHLFDELPVPRPTNSDELAAEIDKVFSDWKVKVKMIETQDEYVKTNSWNSVTDRYLEMFHKIRNENKVVL